jgi:peptidoglycan/xylan/chitin deacetylase (PgdA/CDA1 family)
MSRTGLKKIWEAAQWLKYRVRSGTLILMYHRVTNLPNDPHLVAVTPKHFADHMEMIQKHYMPIRLEQLVEALRDGKVPTRAVIVTFDDGYADNFHEAMPLLERYDVPATVFVTAGQVGSQREFWWDELDRLLLQPGMLPVKFRLNVNGNTFESQLGEASTYTEADYRRDRGWHIARGDDPGPRQHLFRKLLAAMSTLPGGERKRVLDELLAWAGADPIARPTHRPLTIDELVKLQKCHLMEVGAHTMTHPKLADTPAAQQRIEIQQSKKVLEAMLNRPVTSFAFPFGSSAPETVAMVRDEGFVCACSTRSDVVFRGADRFLLPRVIVRDWDGERFGRFLRWWMGG